MNEYEIREITRNYPLSLLLETDPDIKKIEKYLNKGRCFGLFLNGTLIAEYVLKANKKEKSAEIVNLSVAEEHRRKGYARILINDALKRSKEEGFKSVRIATGKDSFQQIFYQSCGFEICAVEKDYFPNNYDAPVIDGGIELKDRVCLKKVLE